jgi:ribonuclease HI
MNEPRPAPVEDRVIVYTDGGCAPNPGPGGWAAILIRGTREKELKGGALHSTNNRMELIAAISALEAIKPGSKVDMHTDSQYVRDGITRYIDNWKRNGWRTYSKEPVKNDDLWRRLDAAAQAHIVNWHWVKGHSGDHYNDRADELVHEAREEVKRGINPALVMPRESRASGKHKRRAAVRPRAK